MNPLDPLYPAALGGKLKAAREAAEMTQERVMMESGITVARLNHIEQGKSCPISQEWRQLCRQYRLRELS